MRASFDEMQATGTTVRDHYRVYERWLAEQPGDVMRSRRTPRRTKTAPAPSA